MTKYVVLEGYDLDDINSKIQEEVENYYDVHTFRTVVQNGKLLFHVLMEYNECNEPRTYSGTQEN